MLKGWVDRVFAYGRAYKSDCSHATGVFRGKLSYAGFSVLAPHIAFGIDDATAEQRAALLTTWAARLEKIAGESLIDVGEH